MAAADPDATGRTRSHEWFLDSGAASHMIPYRSIFTTYKRLAVETRVKVANGAYVAAVAKGDVAIYSCLTIGRLFRRFTMCRNYRQTYSLRVLTLRRILVEAVTL